MTCEFCGKIISRTDLAEAHLVCQSKLTHNSTRNTRDPVNDTISCSEEFGYRDESDYYNWGMSSHD